MFQITDMPQTISLQPQYNSCLNEADFFYLDSTFGQYRDYVKHVRSLIDTLQHANDVFAATIDESAQISCCSISHLQSPVEALEKLLESTTESIVIRLERYFISRYNLQFKSALEVARSQFIKPLEDYSALVEHIRSQVGPDFLQAGKDQIISRFLHALTYRKAPQIKVAKIIFYDLASYNEHYDGRISLHRDYGTGVRYLLDAISLVFRNTTELPPEFKTVLGFLEATIDFSQAYQLTDFISISFCKNRRVDLHFPNPASALRFWNFFELSTRTYKY